MPVSRARYTLLALLFSVLWASAFSAAKVALQYAPPLLLMSTRFLVAGGALLLYAWLRGIPIPRRWPGWRPLVILGVLNIALYMGVTAALLLYLSAGLGAVLASTTPLVLALVAPRFLGERLTLAKATGLAVAYAGVAWAMWGRRGDHDSPVAMAGWLVCVGFLVAGTIFFKRWALREDLVVINGGQLVAGGLALLPATLVLESYAGVRVTPALLLAQTHLIVATSIAAMGLWLWLLRAGDATRASAYFFLNPVLGVFIGALVVGEPLRAHDFLAAAVVGVGIAIVQRG